MESQSSGTISSTAAMAENQDISSRLKSVTLADVIVTTVETGEGISQDILGNTENEKARRQQQLVSPSSASSADSPPLPDPQSLPLTAYKAYSIANTRTFFHAQVFRDRTMLTCSQIPDGRIATWLLCKPIMSSMVPSYPGSHIDLDLDVMPLLGAREADVVVFNVLAKQIISSIGGTAATIPLLLGLGLPKMENGSMENRELFHTIAHLMSQLYQHALNGMD